MAPSDAAAPSLSGLAQPGILAPLPSHARYLRLTLRSSATAPLVRQLLAQLPVDPFLVVGFGPQLVNLLELEVPALRHFPTLQHGTFQMPATDGDLWLWLRAEDRGALVHLSRYLIAQLNRCFTLTDLTDSFVYGGGLDLTGYEDGTENPTGDDAEKVGLADGTTAAAGSSFVAVQKWLHDFDRFDGMPTEQQDHSIGRRRSDNVELDDAPETAHVKRTAQEAFDPEAFVVRRSMPWAEGIDAGLMFVSFGANFDGFEALARNMLGVNDDIVDALFEFTGPVSGNYYWCPPLSFFTA
jgi:porphyrinogen peroxidase